MRYEIIIVGLKKDEIIETKYNKLKNQVEELRFSCDDLEEFRREAHFLIDEAASFFTYVKD
jgi:hypothetical protein